MTSDQKKAPARDSRKLRSEPHSDAPFAIWQEPDGVTDDDSRIAAELHSDILAALATADRAKLDRLPEALLALRGQAGTLAARRAELLSEIERVFNLLRGQTRSLLIAWGHQPLEASIAPASPAASAQQTKHRSRRCAHGFMPGLCSMADCAHRDAEYRGAPGQRPPRRFVMPRGLIPRLARIDVAFRELDPMQVLELFREATFHERGGAGKVGPLDVAGELAVLACALELGPREGENFDAAKERAKAALKDAKKQREKNRG